MKGTEDKQNEADEAPRMKLPKDETDKRRKMIGTKRNKDEGYEWGKVQRKRKG